MGNTKIGGAGELSGYIGPGTEVNGEIKFADTLRVDGKITGKVVSDNELIVGETGEIDAEIEVGSISVTGKISGSATIKNKIEIHRNGAVRADLQLHGPNLIIEEGGILEGSVDMGQGAPRHRDKEKQREKVRADGGKVSEIAAPHS
jgi:cytoskeletal protein CcmA (bactofilin family)